MTIVADIILTHAYPLMAVSSSFMASIFRFQLFDKFFYKYIFKSNISTIEQACFVVQCYYFFKNVVYSLFHFETEKNFPFKHHKN